MAKKLESTFLNMVLVLLLITAVSAAALGLVYNITKEPIEKAKAEKLQKAIAAVLPTFDKIEEKEIMPETGKDPLVFFTATQGGQLVGTAVKTYTDIGFAGRFTIMVGFLPDGSINKTAVVDHKETPGLGDKMDISKSDFPLQFEGKNPASFKLKVKKDGGDVDAITAATISSRGFCDALTRAHNTFTKEGGTK
ncbi:MAG: RnfABCDGE type electron transport complex subunit G [Bacteroidetes bacterium]|nr:RnfABCDGE type electron transport complex subunit G [Bacteroidota bacterium]MBU1719554.1 RnfABCDGE type electron transport complex subunit G [Bacteroidota bacterium]